MEKLIPYALICIYSVIAFQDFKSRFVSLLNYFLLVGLNVLGGFFRSIHYCLDQITLNVLFLMAVLSLTFVYYLLRYRELVYKRIKESIGWGDVLMVPFLLVTFSFGNFVVVFMFSLMVSIFWFVVGTSSQQKTIPLAGILSGIIVLAFLLNLIGVMDNRIDLINFM